MPKAIREGRTYAEFLAFIEQGDIASWVEMDTVTGREGGKAIMTFDFTICNFMFGLHLDDKTAAEAASRICTLKVRLHEGNVRFGDVFPLLLTDNGGEFANIDVFIQDLDGTPETELFFCDPYQSSQKPRVEKNHTMFRDIAPKGESFDDYTQETVNLIFPHVNSVKRKILHGKTPYEVFSYFFSESIVRIPGIFLPFFILNASRLLLLHLLWEFTNFGYVLRWAAVSNEQRKPSPPEACYGV